MDPLDMLAISLGLNLAFLVAWYKHRRDRQRIETDFDFIAIHWPRWMNKAERIDALRMAISRLERQ